MCFFPIGNDPPKRITKFLTPTQSRDNPQICLCLCVFSFHEISSISKKQSGSPLFCPIFALGALQNLQKWTLLKRSFFQKTRKRLTRLPTLRVAQVRHKLQRVCTFAATFYRCAMFSATPFPRICLPKKVWQIYVLLCGPHITHCNAATVFRMRKPHKTQNCNDNTVKTHAPALEH